MLHCTVAELLPAVTGVVVCWVGNWCTGHHSRAPVPDPWRRKLRADGDGCGGQTPQDQVGEVEIGLVQGLQGQEFLKRWAMLRSDDAQRTGCCASKITVYDARHAITTMLWTRRMCSAGTGPSRRCTAG